MAHNEQRGVVLVIVLVILAGMTLMLAGIVRLTLTGHSSSLVGRVTLGAKPLFVSAEKMAAGLLLANHAEATPDTMHEAWAESFPVLVQGISSGLESAELAGRITDESARFPLPAMFARSAKEEVLAQKYTEIFVRLTARLLVMHGVVYADSIALEKAKVFAEAILRWGGDRRVQPDPGEWQGYLEGTPSRISPGTRLLSTSELLLVHWKGVGQEQARRVILGGPRGPGLVDLVTVWGMGPMNINTLKPFLVHALIPDPGAASEFVSYVRQYRDNPENELKGLWYKEAALGSVDGSHRFPFACLGESSRYFRVELTVRYGAAEARGIGVCRVRNDHVQWLARNYY